MIPSTITRLARVSGASWSPTPTPSCSRASGARSRPSTGSWAASPTGVARQRGPPASARPDRPRRATRARHPQAGIPAPARVRREHDEPRRPRRFDTRLAPRAGAGARRVGGGGSPGAGPPPRERRRGRRGRGRLRARRGVGDREGAGGPPLLGHLRGPPGSDGGAGPLGPGERRPYRGRVPDGRDQEAARGPLGRSAKERRT